MHKKTESLLYSAGGLVAALIILVLLNLVLGAARGRIDLTQGRLYTLSEGTRAVLGKLESPVKIRLYFSQSDIPLPIKAYGRRVEDLLAEFRQAGRGKVTVEKLDPQPDSDAEDSATLEGVEAQVTPSGDKFYLGASISYADQKLALPALAPDREALLEYDLVRAIARAAATAKPLIGVMSALPVFGMPPSPMTGGQRLGPRLRLGEGRARHALPHGRGSAHAADAALAQRQCFRSARHRDGAARVVAYALCGGIYGQARRGAERNGSHEEFRVLPARRFVRGNRAGRGGRARVQAFGHRVSAGRAPDGEVQDRVSRRPAQGRRQGREESGEGVRRKIRGRAAQGIGGRERGRPRRGQRFHQRRRGGTDPGDLRTADRDPAQRQHRLCARAGGPVRRRPRPRQAAPPRERRAAVHRDPRHGGEGAAGLPRQDQGAGGQPRADAGKAERAAKRQGAGRGGDSLGRTAERARELQQESRGDAPRAERGPPRAARRQRSAPVLDQGAEHRADAPRRGARRDRPRDPAPPQDARDMNRRQFLLALAVLAVLAAAGAAVVLSERAAWTAADSRAGQKVIAGLRLSEVAEIAILDPAGELHLARG